MRRLFLVAALAALATPAFAQGPPPTPGGGGGGTNNLPFKDVTTQNWGRAKANTTNGVGNPHSDEDYQPHGPDANLVSAFSSDGPATASSTGFMQVSYSPVSMRCDSYAHGRCSPVSAATPAPAVDADYNCRARTEASSTNADTKDRNIHISISGSRSSLGKDNVTGWCKILITRVNGTEELIHVKINKNGWKVVGSASPISTENFSYDVEKTLGPGDSVGITSVAEASSDGETDDDTESSCRLIVSVAAIAPLEPAPPAPPLP